MKAVYETPNVHFERFEAANSIAAICSGIDEDYIYFDCLRGGDLDKETLISQSLEGSSCNGEAEYFAASDSFAGVINLDTHGNEANWSENSTGFDMTAANITLGQKSYNATVATLKSAMQGFFIYCTGGDDSHWQGDSYSTSKVDGATTWWNTMLYGGKTYLYHEDGHHNSERNDHVEVAGVRGKNVGVS